MQARSAALGAALTAEQAAAAAAGDEAPTDVCPGLSASAVDDLTRGNVHLDSAALGRQKLALLNLFAAAEVIGPQACVLHLQAACCDSNGAVAQVWLSNDTVKTMWLGHDTVVTMHACGHCRYVDDACMYVVWFAHVRLGYDIVVMRCVCGRCMHVVRLSIGTQACFGNCSAIAGYVLRLEWRCRSGMARL